MAVALGERGGGRSVRVYLYKEGGHFLAVSMSLA